MIEHVELFLMIIIVGSLFYIFDWYIPKKIANSKEGELENWPDIKKRLKNKNTLFVILFYIIASTVLIMLYPYTKSTNVDEIADEKLVKSIGTKDNVQYVVCPTYDCLNQLDEKQKNIVYVHAPKDKRGMYIWAPNENRWILVTK